MKKFYNRQQEMNQLLDMQRQAFEDYSRFVVQVEAYEVKRNPQKYNPSRLREKVGAMQRHLYRGREVKMQGLSMEEM